MDCIFSSPCQLKGEIVSLLSRARQTILAFTLGDFPEYQHNGNVNAAILVTKTLNALKPVPTRLRKHRL